MAECEVRNPDRFYKPSGVVPITGWIAMLALGGLAADLSGAVEGYLWGGIRARRQAQATW